MQQQSAKAENANDVKARRRAHILAVRNKKGREPGVPNRTTRVLKDAILHAAAVAGGTADKPSLENFLIREAKKSDNRAFMMLLGKVLPMTVAFDKNRPLRVVSTVHLVRPDDAPPPPRDVTPRGPRTIDGRAVMPPPAPRAPPKVPAPSRSGT